MIEPEFVDEERIPLLERDENIEDDSVYEDTQQETSFNEQEATQTELDTEINALERGFNVKIPYEDRSRFRRSRGYLQVERSPQVNMPISQNQTANSSQKVPCATVWERLLLEVCWESRLPRRVNPITRPTQRPRHRDG